jgi:Holliday junction resolvase RusA-like endonuclease
MSEGKPVDWTCVIYGAPRTKKTSNRLVRAGKRAVVLPSKAWATWVQEAKIRGLSARLPLTAALNCRAVFYRDADRGDAVGYYQGLADLLEKRRVIANDKQIVSWDGSRLLKDATNPRVEVTLEEYL